MRLQRLKAQFEALARGLKDCRDPVKRKETFRKMKVVIHEIDQLIFNEQRNSDSKANSVSTPDSDVRVE